MFWLLPLQERLYSIGARGGASKGVKEELYYGAALDRLQRYRDTVNREVKFRVRSRRRISSLKV